MDYDARSGRARVFTADAAGHVGLGLINVNLFIAHVVRAEDQPAHLGRRPWRRRSASTCSRRASSRWRWPRSSSPPSRAMRPPATRPCFRATVGWGARQIAFLLVPAAAACTALAEADRAPALPARRVDAAQTTAGRRALPLLGRPRLQRRAAPAQPLLLQPPAGLGADPGSPSATSLLNTVLAWLVLYDTCSGCGASRWRRPSPQPRNGRRRGFFACCETARRATWSCTSTLASLALVVVASGLLACVLLATWNGARRRCRSGRSWRRPSASASGLAAWVPRLLPSARLAPPAHPERRALRPRASCVVGPRARPE